MATPRSKTFTVRTLKPAKGEPSVLTDESSWCWKLLNDNGAGLHKLVRHSLYPGIGLKGRGSAARRQLYAACVLHLVVTAVEEHRVAPTYVAIADALNESGVETWYGKRWNRHSVYNLLTTYGLIDVIAQQRHPNNLAFALHHASNPRALANMTRWPV